MGLCGTLNGVPRSTACRAWSKGLWTSTSDAVTKKVVNTTLRQRDRANDHAEACAGHQGTVWRLTCSPTRRERTCSCRRRGNRQPWRPIFRFFEGAWNGSKNQRLHHHLLNPASSLLNHRPREGDRPARPSLSLRAEPAGRWSPLVAARRGWACPEALSLVWKRGGAYPREGQRVSGQGDGAVVLTRLGGAAPGGRGYRGGLVFEAHRLLYHSA